MNLTIHRGTEEIGGSCVELQTKEARILIDFGLPLDKDLEKKVKKKSKEQLIKEGLLPDVKGLYESAGFDAILISHSHKDHYGLLSYVHKDIPIYMSKGTKELIDVGYTFNQTNCKLDNVVTKEAGETFPLKDIKVKTYQVDHSGFDAFAFLIEAEGKKIFYTGDFRSHGRKGVLFWDMIKNPPKDIDYLIMEGTMLSREDEECKTEKDIEEEMVKFLRATGNLTFLACSSQNIDRLVTAYRACVRSETLLVLDPYTAYVLHQIKDLAKVPQYENYKNLRIFFLPNKYTDIVLKEKKMWKFKKAKITTNELFSLKNKMLVKDSYTMRNIFKNKKLLSGSTVIHSEWENYLENTEDFWNKNNVDIKQIHVSGHAYVKDLVRLANAIKPKYIIPIHTEKAEKYEKYFKYPIKPLQDGKKFII